MQISELAEQVGVPASTVRYYERIGLLADPARTASGYRDYDDLAAARLLFITRARNMGLSCDQIGELLPIWDGSNCEAAQERVSDLIETKRAEILQRIEDLSRFAEQLDSVRDAIEDSPAPATCSTDLSCCVPETDGPSPVTLLEGVSRR